MYTSVELAFLLMAVFNSFLAAFTLLVASVEAVLIASDFFVSAYDLAEFNVVLTFVSTLAFVS